MSKHVCSPCGGAFKDGKGYLDHVCPKSKFKPTDPRHLGPAFAKVQAAAVARGAARK